MIIIKLIKWFKATNKRETDLNVVTALHDHNKPESADNPESEEHDYTCRPQVALKCIKVKTHRIVVKKERQEAQKSV
jgi:hypothetical protein